MLLPYYIAALNIEHAYYEQTGEIRGVRGVVLCRYAGFGGSSASISLSFMTEKNTERVERQKRSADHGDYRESAV